MNMLTGLGRASLYLQLSTTTFVYLSNYAAGIPVILILVGNLERVAHVQRKISLSETKIYFIFVTALDGYKRLEQIE